MGIMHLDDHLVYACVQECSGKSSDRKLDIYLHTVKLQE